MNFEWLCVMPWGRLCSVLLILKTYSMSSSMWLLSKLSTHTARGAYYATYGGFTASTGPWMKLANKMSAIVFIGAWIGGLARAQHWRPRCLNETREPPEPGRVLWRHSLFSWRDGLLFTRQCSIWINKSIWCCWSVLGSVWWLLFL